MNLRLFIFSVTLSLWIIFSVQAHAIESSYFLRSQSFKSCDIRVVTEAPPDQPIKADVLFLIGFADRADNHSPLFTLLSHNGYRVISFDFPSHGETRCGDLNFHNYSTLISMTLEVEKRTRSSNSTPLILSGWSTGGLLAVRMAQIGAFTERVPQKMFLLAPGISVYPLVGGDGIVRQETLLSNPNPPHRGPIAPLSPLFKPFFSSALIMNSLLAQYEDLPKNMSTLMIIGSDTLDLYADSVNLRVWYRNQVQSGSDLRAIQCFNSRHEVDNELEPIGETARQSILNFLEEQNSEVENNPSVCRRMH